MSKDREGKYGSSKIGRRILTVLLILSASVALAATKKPLALFLNDPAYEAKLSPIERSLADQGIKYEIFRIFKDELPEDETEFSGVIVAGGDSMRNYIDWSNNIYRGGEIILAGEIPILGICLGHQIVSRVYGSVMYYSEERRWHTVEILLRDRILDGLPDNLLVWQNHAYAAAKVPEGFQLMARTSNTPIQMIKHSEKSIYGVQFHPETPGEFLKTPPGWKLLMNFAKIADAEIIPAPLPPDGRGVYPY
jgi:GMP synthase (glutamine-hydrolysing)